MLWFPKNRRMSSLFSFNMNVWFLRRIVLKTTEVTPLEPSYWDWLCPDTEQADRKHISVKQSASLRGRKILKMKRAKARRAVEPHVERFRCLQICTILTFSQGGLWCCFFACFQCKNHYSTLLLHISFGSPGRWSWCVRIQNYTGTTYTPGSCTIHKTRHLMYLCPFTFRLLFLSVSFVCSPWRASL